MDKKWIFVDCDECLLDLINPLVSFHNKVYGTDLKREDFVSYNLWETWGGTKEQAREKVMRFFNSEYVRKMVPVEYSQEATKALSNKYNLAVLTARPNEARELVLKDINNFFRGSFSKILFSGEWSGNGERRKEDFCEALNPHYLIEDSLDNSRSCAEKGTKILLLDCPWNKCSDEDLPFGAKRVLNWRKIGDVL